MEHHKILYKLPIPAVTKLLSSPNKSLIDYQMIFAESGETISGGNFHGEYPAKVSILTLHLVVFNERLLCFHYFFSLVKLCGNTT